MTAIAQWNDDCENCGEGFTLGEIYTNTVLNQIAEFLTYGNGTGTIKIDGVMEVEVRITRL